MIWNDILTTTLTNQTGNLGASNMCINKQSTATLESEDDKRAITCSVLGTSSWIDMISVYMPEPQ